MSEPKKRSRKKTEQTSGGGYRTVADSKGMTPQELLKARRLPERVYNNIPAQAQPEIEECPDGMDSNTKILKKNLKIAFLPEIDLNDPEQVQKRIEEYFGIEAEYGNKPSVVGLGLALNGMDRRRLWEIVTGKYGNTGGAITRLPKTVTDLLKKAYTVLEQNWNDYMQGGKINPVSGIFLGKNHFGYQDKQEYVVTPNTQAASDFNEQEIRERLGLPDSE